jgi:hypothetical protein
MFRKINFILFKILLLSKAACSQNQTDVLEGQWVLKQVHLQDIYECADVILFRKDKSYQILNDCYGKDGRNPIIEEGIWEYDSDRMLISLFFRKFHIEISDYVYRSTADRLLVSVREIESNVLILCFEERFECKEEKYIKIN